MNHLPPRFAATGSLGRLLNTAVELFAARGYHGVSVRDLTAAMGVKPSSLYAHFPSKEDLFAHLVFLANEEIHERLRSVLLESGPDPVRQLRAHVRCYVTFHGEYPLLAAVGHHDPHVLGKGMDRVMVLRRAAIDLLLAIIKRGNESGAFACADPWLAVAAIAGMGIRVASWFRPPGYQADPSFEAYPLEVHEWTPGYTAARIAETYADYALGIVRA
ncbi:TetR/AcrR family transcriptional regulator [Crossiella cryophila]|uniref:AcrR family transcriptional regulator n=1 Tax=Crossiella cryophila TaxID=43355 RepID=A0A7W7FXC1_9PSEU|nr:TetR/AcrR family transcriptional regulator [Crossiella cryophila]MBB4678759.1 AcrR family transcriptional regulator [Crossiella cryophila]